MPPHGIYALVALEEALDRVACARQLGDGETGLACASVGSMRQLHHHLNRAEAIAGTATTRSASSRRSREALNFNFAPLLGIRGSKLRFRIRLHFEQSRAGRAHDEISLGQAGADASHRSRGLHDRKLAAIFGDGRPFAQSQIRIRPRAHSIAGATALSGPVAPR